GRLNEAVTQLNRSAKLFGTEGKVTDWLFLAMTHHRLGNSGEARRWLEKAVQWLDESTLERPKDAGLGIPVPWSTWLQVQLLRQEAEVLIKGTPHIDPEPAPGAHATRLAYARAHLRLGQWDQAAADFSRVIERRPKDLGLRTERLTCYLRLGQWEKAALDFDVLLEVRPTDLALQAERGRCRLRAGKANEAAADFIHIVERRQASFDKTPMLLPVREALGEAYRELAEAQRAQGRVSDAVATLGRLRDLWPGHAAHL